MKKKFLFPLTLLLSTVIALSACSGEEVNNSVKVTPSELFQGDTIRLKPHMNMISGCVQVEYMGNKDNMSLKYEVWEEGNLKIEREILSSPIEENKFDGEISISIKDINSSRSTSDSMEMTTVIRTEEGYSSTSGPIDRFNGEYGHSPQELQNEINVAEDEEITIWGLTAGDKLFSGGEDIQKSIEKSKWGLVVKLYFE